MQKKWVIKDQGDPVITGRLANELNIDKLVSNLLVQRGIKTFGEAKTFFRPELSMLHDPFLMKDMDLAVYHIEKSIENKEKILIYGDYDVDGTTAVALVYSFFKEYYNSIAYYIPDRKKEGYGISKQGVDYAKKNGFSLIIALDCGIKSVEIITYAKELGVDFIVCDHHLPGTELPPAAAILDPKREDCMYPYDELSGCGIGLKLVQAYSQKHNISFETIEQYLDLTAVSIACDIVPINGENRVLAYHGLKRINNNPRPGFKAMMELNNLKKEITISNLVFTIGPRINAAGRVDHGSKAVELLTSEHEDAADISGHHINNSNTERKTIDSNITREALEMIEKDDALLKSKTTVLFHPDWHKGVIGIVASRLIETYYRPTVILTQSNGVATGSVRSVRGFNVYDAIEACGNLLEQYGGHKYAAGLTLKVENIPAFRKKFEKVVSETITEDQLIPQVEIDMEIGLHDITPKFNRVLKQFAPYGPQNMAPVFKTSKVMDKGYARIVGKDHLKLNITDPSNPKKTFAAIAFGHADKLDIIKNRTFDICYTVEENEWNGNIELQLVIKDIKYN